MAKRKTRSEEESYRIWFFIIGQLLMLSMVWLLYQEFFSRRPWKDVQLGWFEVEKTRATKNLEAEKKWLKDGTLVVKDEDGEEEEVDVGARVKALNAEIQELEGAIVNSDKRVEYEQLKADLKDAQIIVKDEEMRLAFAKAFEDEYYYYYRHAKHAGHADEIAKYEKEYNDRHEAVLAASAKYDAATAKRDVLLDKVSAIQAELAKKKTELAELSSGLATAQRAYDTTNKKRWPSIEQYWNQEIDLVDRCQTCHIAWDKCGYTDPEEILTAVLEKKQTEAELRRFYCITRAEAEAYLEVAEEVRDSWYEDEKLTTADVRDKLLLIGAAEDAKKPTEPVVATAMDLGMDVANSEQLYRTHPHFWDLMSKHPAQTYGCTTCHYGQGRQTKGIGLNYLAAYLWKGDKFLAPFDHATSDHYWIEQILDNERNHTEASCFNCHMNDYELEFAPNFTQGRKLVQHIGCTGCHPLGPLDPERKHGPPLVNVKSKIDTAWLNAWVQYPRGIRPRTRMPNFWPNALTEDGKVDKDRADCNTFDYEKGGPPSPAVWVNCAQQRDEESGYIIAYLLDKSGEVEAPKMPASADPAKGEELVKSVGCRGCHNIDDWTQASNMPGSEDRDLAPNLTEIGAKVKTAGWFYNWVKDPKSWWEHTRMPSLRLTDAEAWNVAAYLYGKKGTTDYAVPARTQAAMEHEEAVDRGQKLIGYYGCAGCHDIEGFENQSRIGADLTLFGSKLAHKLDFGDVEELVNDPHEQNWENWLRQKMRHPRSYTYERATTKMPKFDLSEREIDLIVLFLKSQNEMAKDYPEQVKHMQDDRDRAIQRGEYLLDVYNCSGCHLIDNQGIDIDGDRVLDGGDIYRLFADTEDKYRAPPKLIRQGAKVYPDWFYKFLKAPFKLRENYVIRMPTFQLDDETAQEIVAYFAAKENAPYPYVEKKVDMLSAADQATADKLFAEAQCLNCHNLGGGEVTDPKNVAPNLRLTYERLQYDWLFHWLKNPQEQIPGVGMPNFFIPVEDEPGVYETPLTEIAGGDWKRQVELLRTYVIQLGAKEKAKDDSAEAAPPPPKKKKRRRG